MQLSLAASCSATPFSTCSSGTLDFDVGPIDNTDYLSDGLSDYLSDAPTFEDNFGVDPSLLFKEVMDTVDTSQNVVWFLRSQIVKEVNYL